MNPVLKLYILIVIHIFIWLFVFFAGFINIWVCKFILVVALPLIYILQGMPHHALVKSKIKLIQENMKHFKKLTSFNFIPSDYFDMEEFSRKTGIPKSIILDSMLVMKYYEGRTVLPRFIDNMKYVFRESFRNPVDAQGMTIIAFIINVYLCIFRYR